MLCNIDHHLVEDARRISTLLCFASRPWTVPELIDGITVELEGVPGLSRKCRLRDADGIDAKCLGFIKLRLGQKRECEYEKELVSIVPIPHFSVQEYLGPGRIRHSRAVSFRLTKSMAHAVLAQILLAYYFEYNLSTPELNEINMEDYLLASFAVERWHDHAKHVADASPDVTSLATPT